MNWVEFVKVILDNVADTESRYTIYSKMIQEDYERDIDTDEVLGIDEVFDEVYSDFFDGDEEEEEFEEDEDYDYDDE